MNGRSLLLRATVLLVALSLPPASSANTLSHNDLCTRLCGREEASEPQPSGAPQPPWCSGCPPDATCPLPCPAPVCPKPHCPTVSCPEPRCPTPVCPPITPSCPSPSVSCPQPVCPQPLCPDCPKLPPIPACPSCPPCPMQSLTSGRGVGPGGCAQCLWRVLVTYDHFRGFGFYKAYKLPLTWQQANTTCTNDGGHLAVINSEAEANILKLLFQKSQLSGWIFIGFHDLYHEGNYVTVVGKPLSQSGYVNWLPGQPDNQRKIEHCGTIDSRAFFNDLNCNSKVGFICEVPEKKALGL